MTELRIVLNRSFLQMPATCRRWGNQMSPRKFSRLPSSSKPRLFGSSLLTAAIVVGFSSVAFYGLAAQTLDGPRNSLALRHADTNPLRDALDQKKTLQIANYTVDAARLQRVYESRGFRPIWTRFLAGGDVRAALEAFAHAADEGLSPANYRLEALTALQKSGDSSAFELLMTDTVLTYARDLRQGRVAPAQVDDDVLLPAGDFDVAAAFAAAADSGIRPFLADAVPAHPEYARLKMALARYRALAEAGGWDTLPSGTKADDVDIGLLRARLRVEDRALGDAAGPDEVLEALQRFQARNGLKPDGKVGKKTLAALNISPDERVSQIAANMERWRWMPHNFEQRYIAVNTADATLDFIDNGRVALSSNVVVGQPDKRTPILRAEAIAVTVNPVWHVPYSIASKELLPKLRRNPSYLQSEGMILANGPAGDPHGLNVDWDSMRGFPFAVRQLSGPKNALGVLKIEMPNKFNVYLHDTPSKRGFAADSRQLSHGCVRVEQINALASLAWKGDMDAGIDELKEMIDAGETQKLPFSQPIPVYLAYWTALVDENGDIEFRPDVYGRDRQLIATLNGQRVAARSTGELGI